MTSKLLSLREAHARTLAALGLLAVVVLGNALAASPAQACSCMVQSVEEAALAATTIFDAGVLNALHREDGRALLQGQRARARAGERRAALRREQRRVRRRARR